MIIYTLGLSSVGLSQYQMGTFSITAKPEEDSEIVGEDDDGV